MTTWVDLENIMLSEVSQTEKDKNQMISLMWDIKQQTNKTKKLIDTDNPVVVTRGEGAGGSGKVGQMFGDRKRFEWWTYNAIYR